MASASRSLQLSWHRRGYRLIAGIDEAGRGPLAGPVVAAAVVVAPGDDLEGVNDSKALSSTRREGLFRQLVGRVHAYGLAVVSPAVIDEINILQATLLAMGRALLATRVDPDLVVVDGRQRLPYPCCQYALVRGDARCQAVAAASIMAKVVRDRLMLHYHRRYPEYDFQRHKGYGTRQHRQAVLAHGRCPIHRCSFRVA
ncbi:MAG: ribonuclease HII [Deltaproteobacteria bacterium]|jgi:ribonuclease HII|nr:ribonuclease HII [Deltaproteobacteria bacterium]